MGKLPKKQFDLKDLVLIVVIIFLIILNLILVLKKVIEPKRQQEKNETQIVVLNENDGKNKSDVKILPRTDEETVKYLAGLNERGRMEYYCGQFFKYIRYKEYEKAYSMLYSEFKENYFKTEEEFEKYVKDHYPELLGLEYDDIQKLGNMFIIRLKLHNLGAEGDGGTEHIVRVVVQEYYYNSYKISFQVEE